MKILFLFVALLWSTGAAGEEQAAERSVPAVPDNPGLPEERAAALEAVNAFLSLVDQRKEAQAWPGASGMLRYGAGSLANWQANLSSMHADLGRPRSRSLKRIGFTDGLGDIPKGRYYVLHFNARFEKAEALEEVVVAMEGGYWRVAGYIVSGIKRNKSDSGSAPNNSSKPTPLRGAA